MRPRLVLSTRGWQFCEEALAEEQEEIARLDVMWVLVQVALSSGLPERALAVAEEIRQRSLRAGWENWAATAAGLKADVLFARGDLDEALRIRREEQLPVYQRLGGRDLAVGRTNLALTLLIRNRAGDRGEAQQLLGSALADARPMRLPEAQQIEAFLKQSGLSCD